MQNSALRFIFVSFIFSSSAFGARFTLSWKTLAIYTKGHYFSYASAKLFLSSSWLLLRRPDSFHFVFSNWKYRNTFALHHRPMLSYTAQFEFKLFTLNSIRKLSCISMLQVCKKKSFYKFGHSKQEEKYSPWAFFVALNSTMTLECHTWLLKSKFHFKIESILSLTGPSIRKEGKDKSWRWTKVFLSFSFFGRAKMKTRLKFESWVRLWEQIRRKRVS